MIRIAKFVATVGWLGIAPLATAGPDWDEIPDAGKTPADAQVVSGSGGRVKTIRGDLTGSPLQGDPDFEDMYRIVIDQPTIFCARTVPPIVALQDCCERDTITPLQGTDFDTQLWLFDSAGLGLLGNDDNDEPGMAPLSKLEHESDDGTAVMLVAAGTYYIAISGGPSRDPISASGAIFDQASLTEISGPDGVGGADPIIDWTGSGVTGEYEIVLCGVVSIPAIPTVSEWGMIALAAGVLVAGGILISRRSKQAVTAKIA